MESRNRQVRGNVSYGSISVLGVGSRAASPPGHQMKLQTGAVETKSVGVITTDRKYRTLTSDAEMVWPDGISYSPDGYMYVSASQVSAAAMFHGGKAESKTRIDISLQAPGGRGHLSLTGTGTKWVPVRIAIRFTQVA